jgi:hypothetical protein
MKLFSEVLAANPEIGWEEFRAYLGSIATEEERASLGEKVDEQLPLAIVDTAAFGTAPATFLEEHWRQFMDTSTQEGVLDLSHKDQSHVFAIALRAGIIAVAQNTEPPYYTIPSPEVYQRLDQFAGDLP